MFQPEYDVPLACAICLVAALISTVVAIRTALVPRRSAHGIGPCSPRGKQYGSTEDRANAGYRIVVASLGDDRDVSSADLQSLMYQRSATIRSSSRR